MDRDQDPERNAPSDPAMTSIHARRAIDGDVRSLEWLVARLTPILVAHAAYRLGPALRVHHEPEDLVQDAWLIVLPRLATLQIQHGRAAPVLLKFLSSTITLRVQNLLRKHVRSDGRKAGVSGDALDELPCDASGAVTRAMRRERRDELQRQFDELEPRDREILLLRGIEQLPARTVATLLELSESAIHKRYERALGRLRRQLPGSLFDDLPDADSPDG